MNQPDYSPDYSIVARTPSVEDYLRLRAVAGLSPFSREAAEKGLRGTVFSVLALHAGSAIGMGRLIGDGGCFFQVVDIAVDPAHQGRGLGKAVMDALMSHVKSELPASAYVSLIADVPANRLYEKFGFRETAPRSLGMAYRVSTSA
ncbi:GNAT family N-acetyltransferase [Rhizobium sp. AU243]|uniref:GNAT family N-acetyltransferase n=1 Tax=Rhizobium sp. AU243 TaxID=2303425 RepID=UPI0010CB4806|nr:GNAT family N-acetyltransferase [Rhizobium sp. AU243]TKV74477.1 N-acetyltransferase [Rhizobium sp. AU243]